MPEGVPGPAADAVGETYIPLTGTRRSKLILDVVVRAFARTSGLRSAPRRLHARKAARAAIRRAMP